MRQIFWPCVLCFSFSWAEVRIAAKGMARISQNSDTVVMLSAAAEGKEGGWATRTTFSDDAVCCEMP